MTGAALRNQGLKQDSIARHPVASASAASAAAAVVHAAKRDDDDSRDVHDFYQS